MPLHQLVRILTSDNLITFKINMPKAFRDKHLGLKFLPNFPEKMCPDTRYNVQNIKHSFFWEKVGEGVNIGFTSDGYLHP